ncbi:MAG: hypothetical protein IT300_01930 [Dehalococcoidia bacterium]|nr:hypothetical protein [Dehalococcoidia bacterium]
MAIELRASGARALIEPRYGGRIHQLFVEIDGREEPLLFAPPEPAMYAREPFAGGCYPMAPWPNRIRGGRFFWAGREYAVPLDAAGQALHGLVFDQPWQVVARAGRVVEMVCGFGAGWPWEGRAWQRVELGPGYLALKLEVRSAREAFPAGCGWHPWFRRDVAGSRDVGLAVPAGNRHVLSDHLPTGELATPSGDFALEGAPLGARRLDDCYTGFQTPAARIDWDRLSLTVAFACPRPHLQVYTPPQAFCVEPQTCPPDAFNLSAGATPSSEGADFAAPGRPLSLTSRWTWALR